MNEQIKDLARLAENATAKHFSDRWSSVGRAEFMMIYNQKFTELIVRECLSVIQNNLDGEGCTEFTICGFKEDLRTIKEHFGVDRVPLK